MSNVDSSLIDSAIIYATEKHKNVERKGNGIPYIIHPLEAMAIVATMTKDHELIAAAALHDLIEDTDVTYVDIEKRFGKRIADIVANESQNMLPGYKENESWIETKKRALEHLKASSLDCKIIALGDKLSNIRAMYHDYKDLGDKFWSRFRESDPRLHKWRYNELTKCFKGLEDTYAYMEFKKLVELTFMGIEDL